MLVVRPERPSDISAISAVHAACFPSHAEARLVDLLRDAGHLSISLVADVDGEIVGHIAFSPVTAECGVPGLGLAPLAVVDSHRGQGVGGELIEQGIRACGFLGVGWVVVLGDPACYERFGFRPASTVGLSDEYGGGDAFQVVEITAGALPVEGGLVRYGSEFAQFA